MPACVFCEIVAGASPATMVRRWSGAYGGAVAFIPLDPVTPGHVLVVPRMHVRDAVHNPSVTAMTLYCALELAGGYDSSNILTSNGLPATQSVFHLHIHVIPRTAGDQLMLPWGTTGDPRAPHRCKGMDELDAALRRATEIQH